MRLTNRENSLQSCQALVLGGGISGITTALVLQSLGFKTALLSDYVPLQLSGEHCPPYIPTGFAMASAYPHYLNVPNLANISADSQAVFSFLLNEKTSGISLYQMYEVFEQEPEPAPLGSQRLGFKTFDGKPKKLKETIDPPFRPRANYLWGWVFDTYFADMPIYLSYLWSLFKEQGGIIQNRHITYEDILKEGQGRNRVLVNCLGSGALNLVKDDAPCVVVRGRQVIVLDAPHICTASGAPRAYNYTPSAEIFARGDEMPEYVHFFSRSDGWILGQTREFGVVDNEGRWSGQTTASSERLIGDCLIPLPIIELNEVLLKNWIGYDLQGRELVGREGLRYYRDPKGKGVRLELDTIEGVPVIHNYGHGGSGITMSWGCALECARLFLKIDAIGPPKSVTSSLGNLFLKRLKYA